jgi:hypothetical protein
LQRVFGFAILIAAIALMGFHDPKLVEATPAAGFSATTAFSGRFEKEDLLRKTLITESGEDDRRAKVWLAQQKPAVPSDLYIQNNVWQPGGSTGWHRHPGHSLIIVTQGTVTEYEGSALNCKAHVYTKGMTFIDPHDYSDCVHAHIVRNESNTIARTTAIQLIPAGTARRIDVGDPGNCRF